MTPFVHSVALVGIRNIRDYKARIRDGKPTLGSASPFNIVTKSLTIRKKVFNRMIYFEQTAEPVPVLHSV